MRSGTVRAYFHLEDGIDDVLHIECKGNLVDLTVYGRTGATVTVHDLYEDDCIALIEALQSRLAYLRRESCGN